MQRVFAIACLLAFLGIAASAQEVRQIPAEELGVRYELLGKLGRPLGAVLKIEGVVTYDATVKLDGGPNLRVQRINGVTTQEYIELPINDIRTVISHPDRTKLVVGKTYRLEGYETGGYRGHPNLWPDDDLPFISTTSHGFRIKFNYVRCQEVEPIKFHPRGFVDRPGLLQGRAGNRSGEAIIFGDSWLVIVDPNAPWPDDVVGRRVESRGRYGSSRESNSYWLVDGSWRLTNLDDQLGKTVTLRAVYRHDDTVEFRGKCIRVENLRRLPGWSGELWAKPIIVRGILEAVKQPEITAPNRDWRNFVSYAIRDASWAPSESLLSPEYPMRTDPVDILTWEERYKQQEKWNQQFEEKHNMQND